MAEISNELWGNMLDLLKDVSNILQKEEDAKLSTVKLADTPGNEGANPSGKGQVKNTAQKPISGGESSGKPGADVIVKAEGEEEEEKTEEEKTEEEETKEEETKEEGENQIAQLMLLLKDIKTALNNDRAIITKSVLADVSKALPTILANENARMLRKMGFQPSRADITRIGLDSEIAPAQSMTADIKKSEPDVTDKMSWSELAARREKLGGFNLF
jgi:hypothetical protein